MELSANIDFGMDELAVVQGKGMKHLRLDNVFVHLYSMRQINHSYDRSSFNH